MREESSGEWRGSIRKGAATIKDTDRKKRRIEEKRRKKCLLFLYLIISAESEVF